MHSNSSFSTTANQKVVHIHRDMPEEKESGFFILKKNISIAPIKIWIIQDFTCIST